LSPCNVEVVGKKTDSLSFERRQEQCESCLQEQDFLDGALVGARSLKPIGLGVSLPK